MKITSLTKPENKKRGVELDKKWYPIAEVVYEYISKIPYKELINLEIDESKIEMDDAGTMITYLPVKKEKSHQKEDKKEDNISYSIKQTSLIQARELICAIFQSKFDNLPELKEVEAEKLMEYTLKWQFKVAKENLEWIKGGEKDGKQI